MPVPSLAFRPAQQNQQHERSLPLERLKGIVGAIGFVILLTILMFIVFYAIYVGVTVMGSAS